MSMENLKMLTQVQVAKILNCSESHVTFLREMGIIPAIKTGRNYMVSPVAIDNFFKQYEGLDVSNRVHAIYSKDLVESRKASKVS